MIKSASGVLSQKCVDGLWGRKAQDDLTLYAQRTRINFTPLHWFLRHMGLY